MKWIKPFLPKSLFGRALLILVLPTLLTQMLMAYVFYDRHWLNVTRYMSNALAGEIAYLVEQLRDAPMREKNQMIRDFELATGLDVQLDNKPIESNRDDSPEFTIFRSVLNQKLKEPVIIKRLAAQDMIEIQVQLPGQLLHVKSTVKRIESPTTTIYLIWMAGSSTLFTFIAIIFLRNQLRPISRLAKAAEYFGRGIDTPDFRPHGALEIRTAAKAFVVMRERIQRQLRTRTDMLSGISHDLRTPLTRMKLQIAMMGDNETTRELADDVQQMEHMIDEYLDFARGEGGEEATEVSVQELLADVVSDYARTGQVVTLDARGSTKMSLKVTGFRRMLHNIIDNAIRYGKQAHMSCQETEKTLLIHIEDEGEGIPSDKLEEVFRPFARLDSSRNSKTGGVGLGLTIARDIALAHGGHIELSQANNGGLRVSIAIPKGKQ